MRRADRLFELIHLLRRARKAITAVQLAEALEVAPRTIYRDIAALMAMRGLDAHHDTETGVPPERVNENTTRVGVDPNGPDRNVRQATVNLFADMGVQPATLAPDLVRVEASDDCEPPVSRIDEPRTGSSVPPGPVQISRSRRTTAGEGASTAVERERLRRAHLLDACRHLLRRGHGAGGLV